MLACHVYLERRNSAILPEVGPNPNTLRQYLDGFFSVMSEDNVTEVPLFTFPSQTDKSLTWLVNLTSGTRVFLIMRDDTGSLAESDSVFIGPSNNTSCLPPLDTSSDTNTTSPTTQVTIPVTTGLATTPPTPAATSAPTPSSSASKKVLGVVLGSVGMVTTVLGIFFALRRMKRRKNRARAIRPFNSSPISTTSYLDQKNRSANHRLDSEIFTGSDADPPPSYVTEV
ncbi:hypothetical protein GALMADRAFT_145737 [Galerina marginata CBS 339.88]|uniref:Uncharacterized protein n=1 Tax=Galerina marginata (strain CBS 339.88) TaxID=685588 RepID=A0A067SMT8_GALM3|nr:hypothetical protein GALMADRAFT_145737 [Galerina marginata CBS 339.88]